MDVDGTTKPFLTMEDGLWDCFQLETGSLDGSRQRTLGKLAEKDVKYAPRCGVVLSGFTQESGGDVVREINPPTKGRASDSSDRKKAASVVSFNVPGLSGRI